jgi:hypothetical protein
VRVPWKLIGVAGLAGVAATGVVVARKHRRLAGIATDSEGTGEPDRDPTAPSDD